MNVRLSLRSFNSRPHKEVDCYSKRIFRDILLSIHDLTRRSTLLMRYSVKYHCLSIHDLTRRSTRSSLHKFQRADSFNSRPHKEVDNIVYEITNDVESFQFTTSQGGRRQSERLHSSLPGLSIHDLTRRSTTFAGLGQ